MYLIDARVLPPPSFETSRLRNLRELAKQRADEEEARKIRLELAYDEYRDEALNAHIASLDPEEFEGRVAAKRKFYRQTLKTLPNKTVDQIAWQGARKDVIESGVVPLMTFDEFARNRKP